MTKSGSRSESLEPWLTLRVSGKANGEARDAPLAYVISTVADRGDALGLTAAELAGILGIAEGDWLSIMRRWPDVTVEEWLDTPVRLLCELLGCVLAFADPMDGARWLRAPHPAMGDSPLGRLIRSPSALPWLSAVLFEEQGS